MRLQTESNISEVIQAILKANDLKDIQAIVGRYSVGFNEYHLTVSYGKVIEGYRAVYLTVKDRSRSILGGMLKDDYNLEGIQGKDRFIKDLK